MQKFLTKSFIEVTDHISRKLQTRDSVGVVTYKKHLMDFTTTYKIFDRTNNLNDKLLKDKLTLDDMKEISNQDDLITKNMLASEGKIKKRQNNYLWSPIPEQAILEVSLWMLIISEIKNEVSKEMQIQRIISQLEAPPHIERHSIKVVVNYFRLAKKSLKQIQTDTTNHREKFLQ